jgi:uncharacterized integral membrane protein (TIGR00698 family)
MSTPLPSTPIAAAIENPVIAWLTRFGPGLMISAVVAALGVLMSRQGWMQAHGLSALTLAIIIGMLVGNTVYPRLAHSCGAGVGFSKQWLLRTGVVLYGLRLTGQDIGNVGVSGVLVDASIVVSTFLLATYLGTRWLGLDRKTSLLIAAGNSICGAAAVMAAEPVVKGKAEQVAVAIATVVVFGTVAIFVYPALYDWNLSLNWIPGGAHGFGVYIGSSVHEVAQVIAAARPVGVEAGDTAVIAKMVRVMMLAPMLLILSWYLAREARRHDPVEDGARGSEAKVSIPWFALAFIGAVAFNSLHVLPAYAVATLNEIDADLLATAMAALGLSTHASAVRKAGMKPLLLAGILFAWLIVGGAAINHWVPVLVG